MSKVILHIDYEYKGGDVLDICLYFQVHSHFYKHICYGILSIYQLMIIMVLTGPQECSVLCGNSCRQRSWID